MEIKQQQNGFLIPSHALINFEIQNYYRNEHRFNGVYSKDNLPEHSSTEIKDEAYIINLDGSFDIETQWVALFVINNDVTYFDSFGVEHIPKKSKNLLGIKT